jgi:hypothetical protein
MRPGAWLVRIVDDGLLVNFRSYLNYHFPAADHTALHISFSSVEWIRLHRIERTLPDNAGEDETSRQRYLELKVSPLLTKGLETEPRGRTPAVKGRRGRSGKAMGIVLAGIIRCRSSTT